MRSFMQFSGMRHSRNISLAIVVFGLLACSEPGKQGIDITQIDSTENTLYIDRSQSSIVINNSGDSTKCYDIKSVDYEIVQIAPEGEWINYIVKRSTATVTCDGQEGQKRTIAIEVSPVDRPKHIAYVIKHDADEIFLEHDYYQTVFYGCCDAEPIHKIYDYSNKMILEGYARILTGAIPNNSIKFFVGYKPSPEDPQRLGSIYLAYDANSKFQIDIMSPALPPEMCSQYSPAITLYSFNRRDTLDLYGDEYQLWELENIESVDQIGNIGISIQYLCDEYYPVEPIEIPITRGKPFGNDSTVQRVTLIHLTEDQSSE